MRFGNAALAGTPSQLISRRPSAVGALSSAARRGRPEGVDGRVERGRRGTGGGADVGSGRRDGRCRERREGGDQGEFQRRGASRVKTPHAGRRFRPVTFRDKASRRRARCPRSCGAAAPVSWPQLIASGEVSSREVVDAHLARIEAVNGTSTRSSSCWPTRRARRPTRPTAPRPGPRGPLHGVPFTVKENIDVAGSPTTSGRPGAGRGDRPRSTRRMVERLRAAGAIPIGAHEPAGPRAAHAHRLLAARADPQPVGPGRDRRAAPAAARRPRSRRA